MNCLYLTHHGIKGQRWGVRRYQNEDGSLTSAGQKRYGDESSVLIVDDKTTKKGLTTAQKILIGVGAAVVVGGAAYGVNKYIKSGKDSVIKSGKKLQRIVRPSEQTEDLYDMFYASSKKADNKRYEVLMPKHYGGMGYKKELTVQKNIKIASEKKAKQVYESLKKEGLTSAKNYNEFNSDLIKNNSVAKTFFKKLSDQGYGAVLDKNDITGPFKTKSPLLFFGDSNKNIKISNVTPVYRSTTKEIQQLLRMSVAKNKNKLIGSAGVVSAAAYGGAWYKTQNPKQGV